MAALTEIDQAPDQEYRALKTIQAQLEAIRQRYADSHPVNIALKTTCLAVYTAELAYLPYLDKRYEAV